METTILLVALIVFAFAISRVLARYASKYFVVSGVEYIVLGLFLGPVAHVLDAATFESLRILMSLLLGVIGMLLGLNSRHTVNSFRGAVAGLLGALVVLVAVSGSALALVEFASDTSASTVEYVRVPWAEYVFVLQASPANVRVAVAIGCCACVSSAAMLSESARVLRARGPVLDFLDVQAVVGQIVGVAVFGAVLASARATELTEHFDMPIVLWGLAIALFGAGSGLLFSRFVGDERNEMRVLVSALGVMTFASGVGVALGVSPIVVNLIAGMTVSFTSPDAPVVTQAMVRLRHPVLVLLRVFVGAAWSMVWGSMWLLLPLYAAVRFVARRFTTYALAQALRPDLPRVPRLGIALVGQGGVAVALALSFALRFPEQSGIVLTTVLGGLVLSDLLSYRAIRRVLADAGELDVADAVEIPIEAAKADGGAGPTSSGPAGAVDLEGPASMQRKSRRRVKVRGRGGSEVSSPGIAVPIDAARTAKREATDDPPSADRRQTTGPAKEADG